MKNFFGKKIFALAAIFFLAQPTYAANATEGTLRQVRDIAYSILFQVNMLPSYIESITQMAQSWIDTEDANNTLANNQFAFSLLASAHNIQNSNQADNTLNLTRDFLATDYLRPEDHSLPGNANDLSYSSVLGRLIQGENKPKDIEAATANYTKNASGITLTLPKALASWRETPASRRYVLFYNTVAAIHSYNAYLLSSLSKQKDVDQINDYLANQASNSAWFTQIGTESLGQVLRQILMYNSQIYVQLNRMAKLQEQQLAAQAMANTILLLGAEQLSGELLFQKAMQSSR